MASFESQAVGAKRRRPKLSRVTMRRLTAVPAHRVRHDNRHFPAGAVLGGSSSGAAALARIQSGLEGSRPASAGKEASRDESPVPETAQERRNKFLTSNNLTRVFKTLDLASDGYIDVDEVFEAVKKIGGTLSRSEIEDAMWEIDDDMDGKLSMADYLTTYRRSQNDEFGFEPRRFFSIVEFLLMDRDCSGEITLDEAMTTLFERQGADNLASVTNDFFRAAGVAEGVTDPPPGTTINFDNYYDKVGCAHPKVPSTSDLRRVYSTKLYVEQNGKPPPKLRPSSSVGQLPRILQPPPSRPHSVSAAGSLSLGARKPNALAALTGSLSGGRAPEWDSPPKRPDSVPAVARSETRGKNMAGLSRSKSGGIMPLKPLDSTSRLALSALGSDSSSKVSAYKVSVGSALKLDRGGGANLRPSERRSPAKGSAISPARAAQHSLAQASFA